MYVNIINEQIQSVTEEKYEDTFDEVIEVERDVADNEYFEYKDGSVSIKEIDQSKIDAFEEEYNSQQYARLRAQDYPDVKDQLDYIYHNGLTKWKNNMIKPIKDKHPK